MEAELERLTGRIRDAVASATPLCIRAGGTKDFYGNQPRGALLDPRPLSGIVAYEPSELVVTALAGTSLAERFANEGGTVSANTPLLLIVELDPITGVMSVTEKDYVRMRTGQIGTLTTDAYPGETFEGRIDRIAPVFQQATRQARIELTIGNAEHKLKPGMFIRVTVMLDRIAEATIVPEKALTTRDNRTGVFVVSENGKSVSWRDVTVGIREGDRVQVEGKGLSGRVVTLGQQLVDDGTPITIPTVESKPPSADPKAAGK